MAWSYSGDPTTSDLDRYRFLIGDTIEQEPVLQDAEIEFVLETNEDHNARLVVLLEAVVARFGRAVKRSLGPQSEDPTGRLAHFKELLEQAKRNRNMAVPSSGGDSRPVFFKGMHDHV